VTGEPKNYAYCLEKTNKKGQSSICKVRGITLNFKNSLDINFNTLKQMVTGKEQNTCLKVIDTNKIVRNQNTCNIITTTETKDYKIEREYYLKSTTRSLTNIIMIYKTDKVANVLL
jgi:hypothetical protein